MSVPGLFEPDQEEELNMTYRSGNPGIIGMGRGDLAKGGGIRTCKLRTVDNIREERDRIAIKTIRRDAAAANFAQRVRKWKSTLLDGKHSLKNRKRNRVILGVSKF